jgi:hypothetical protein
MMSKVNPAAVRSSARRADAEARMSRDTADDSIASRSGFGVRDSGLGVAQSSGFGVRAARAD